MPDNYLQTAVSESTDAGTSHDPSLIEGLLKPTASVLWEYRRTLVAATLVAVVLSGSAAAYLYLTSPVRQVAAVPFRFQFEGARNGKYPSLLPFSESDVVSPAVLTTVYERNELSHYMPFSAFSSGLFVLRTSVEAELLTYEYQSKLSEPRLSTVDRTRLEQEFRNKLQSVPAEYALTFVASRSVNQPPAVLMQKTLDDVLATWARQAIELRGALIADAELLTTATFSSVPVGEDDLLRRIDVLHGKIRRLIDNIVQLERLPGARVLRAPKNDATLPDVRATLEDLLRYEVDPLYTMTMSAGLSDQSAAVQYFESQLRRAQTDAREAEGRRQSLFEALRSYADDSSNGSTAGGGQAAAPGGGGAPVTTQLNENFIDRLMSLSRRQEDLQFRQEMTKRVTDAGFVAVLLQKEEQFYGALLPIMRAAVRPVGGRQTRQDISAALERIQKKAIEALEYARQITVFARDDLKGRGSLYSLAGGLTTTTARGISLNTLGVGAAIAVGTTMMLVSVACLGHHYVRRQRKPQFRSIGSRV